MSTQPELPDDFKRVESSDFVIFSGKRQSGKTTKLVKYANEIGAHLMVHNIAEKRRIETTYNMTKKVLVYKDFFRLEIMQKGMPPMKIVVDNMELFLKTIFPYNTRFIGGSISLYDPN